jgi:TolB protein
VYFGRGEGSQGSSLVRHEIESREDRVLYRAESGRIGHLRWSPGGRWLAFTQSDSDGSDSTLYAFDTGEKKRRRFVSLPSETVESLSWQPGGEKILVGVMQQGHPELWQIPIEGGDAVKLRLPDGWNADVYPHPDGERVAFTTGRDYAEIWVIENLAAALPKVP